jgi:tRNA threonylcarbamoyladenosine modification (KEOPS) complex  Pcc1 subunit
MSGSPSEWEATILVRRRDAPSAERLEAALIPEASREVPRARAQIVRPDPSSIEIRLTARDTGALRAAFNTYLGWIGLAERTEVVGRAALVGSPPQPPSVR